ncbi:MAG: hypothetical protein FD133_1359 [Erysipelotrichaceae bacterium]|nr:MAG: hypothetical protein FD179_645 [Erysipelotrichaceae bacterium]TXT17505.1 MAG: hypothetical protein FD133_1359 [Erysipelotrichaceae bacterium]
MPWIKKVSTPLLLVFICTLLILSILFYHVSAVKVYDRKRREDFVSRTEALFTYDQCEWISEVIIQQRIISVKCSRPNAQDQILHMDESLQLLGRMNADAVKYQNALDRFKQVAGIEQAEISLTLYRNKSVYWVKTLTQEWLLDFHDYSILWKVDKKYD